MLVVEFRYSQTIFLKLTVILKFLIQSLVEHLRWSFFAEIVNVLQPFFILSRELHRGCLTRF